MAHISDLPLELLFEILRYLTRRRDISSLSHCSRALHWWVASELFNLSFKEKSKSRHPERLLMQVYISSIKHDSLFLAQWLTSYELNAKLNGYGSPFLRYCMCLTLSISFVPLLEPLKITFLYLSILRDAPRVAVQLVKNGTDIREGEGNYPDLTPLYLAIAHPQDTPNLNGPLRIACSYALPRMTEYLLARGATPNNLSQFGLAAIHQAVIRWLPWRHFDAMPIPFSYVGDTDVR